MNLLYVKVFLKASRHRQPRRLTQCASADNSGDDQTTANGRDDLPNPMLIRVSDDGVLMVAF